MLTRLENRSLVPRRLALLSLFGLVTLLAGCGGGGDRPELGYVTGKVMLDGQPLPKVIVVFKPEEGRAASATTDNEGNFDLVYRYGVKGAKIGKNSVSFEWPLGEGGPALPKEYTTESTLTEEVASGRNTINFDLKSK